MEMVSCTANNSYKIEDTKGNFCVENIITCVEVLGIARFLSADVFRINNFAKY